MSLASTVETEWCNRAGFVNGRAAVVEFFRGKWSREPDYRLRKELWPFQGYPIAVRFEPEFHDAAGQWWRAYGNANWEFEDDRLMRRRSASINDLKITEAARQFTPGPHLTLSTFRPDSPVRSQTEIRKPN